MQLALYQPDIPQNTGAILRLGACLGVSVHIIEPTGFDASDRALKRAGLDYIAHAKIERHASFEEFQARCRKQGHRLILLTTKADTSYLDIEYRSDDILLLGRESAGVPEEVHARADLSVTIPLAPDMRSLNVAMAASMALGEALRQTGGFSQIE